MFEINVQLSLVPWRSIKDFRLICRPEGLCLSRRAFKQNLEIFEKVGKIRQRIVLSEESVSVTAFLLKLPCQKSFLTSNIPNKHKTSQKQILEFISQSFLADFCLRLFNTFHPRMEISDMSIELPSRSVLFPGGFK